MGASRRINNTPPRILVIGHNYFPELTGIGKYTAEFCQFLSREDLATMSVITGYPHYPKWKLFDGYSNRWFSRERSSGAALIRVPLYIPSKPSGAKRLLMDMTFLFNAFLALNYLMIVERKRYDFVFTPVPSFALGLLSLYYRFFFRGAKVLYHVQDLQIDAAINLGLIRNRTLLRLLLATERFIIRQSDHVSSISEGMCQRIMGKSASLKECILFPNWINNVNVFPILPKPAPANDELRGKRVVFYSGAIGEKQGLEMILKAAHHFQGRSSDLVFVIAGEGPYREKLRDDAAALGLKNLYFYDLLPIEAFNQLLNAAFLHLVIQKESGSDLFLPSKLTNILGIGGCVIVTAAPGTSLHAIVEGHGCGYIISPDNPAELIKAIATLIEDEATRSRLSLGALSYAERFLLQDSLIRKYYSDITTAGRPTTGSRTAPTLSATYNS